MKRAPCRRLIIRAAPGTERWVLSPRQATRLACLISRDLDVEYQPRSAVRRVWARDHGGSPLPADPYAFRAYSRGNKATLFVDDTETRDSALWLLLHELGHLDLNSARLVHRAFRSVPKPANYLLSDDAHEAHPEEQLANRVADQIAPTLGGQAGLGRRWWRHRVLRLRSP